MAGNVENWVTYKDSPARYNCQCYGQWLKLFERFKARIKENIQLANNYSQDLHDRKNDESLSRACLFIPLISPAIWSRVGYMLNLIFAVKEPIEVLPVEPNDTSMQMARNVKTLIHKYLQKDQFRLTCLDMKLAQEQYPISFIKVAEYEEEKKVLEIQDEKMEEYPQADIKLGKKKVWKTVKGQWRPTCVLWTQESVFYDTSLSKWNQKQFVGTVTPLTLGELVSRRKTMSYDVKDETGKSLTDSEFVKLIKEKGEKWTTQDDFNEEVQSSMAGETKEGTEWGTKYKVLENYHKVEDGDGNVMRKITTSTGDVTLWDRDYPYEKLDIPDPFVPVIGYPVLNRVEGISTADQMKHLQHAVNDFFNIIIDAGKYGLFPPRLRDSAYRIDSVQKTTPGAEWIVNVPPGGNLNDGIKQLFTITPPGTEFFAIINVLRELAEITGGAPQDILSGPASSPDETATKTTARVKGMNTRLTGINILQDVEILKRIAQIMWIMTLERLPYDKTYNVGEEQEFGIDDINGDFEFDVPHLSGLAEREAKIQKLQELLLSLKGTPFWNHPAMIPVIYLILKKLAEYSLLEEFAEIFPEELVAQIQAMPIGMGAPGEGIPTAGGSPMQALSGLITGGGMQ